MSKFDDLVDDQNNIPGGEAVPAPAVAPTPHSETYTDEELRDVNAITVTIPDRQTPIVVFFGSPSSGKTLALMRMVRWLEGGGLNVVPEQVFRPKSDRQYARMCASLKEMVYDSYTPGGNDIISFMLAKVLDPSGRPICQFLEAPGEHYFDGSPDLTFPTYINAIRTSPIRKVWVFFVEQDWGKDQGERNMYAQKICSMQSLISPNDKVVFLFNKVDKKRGSQYNNSGRPVVSTFFTNISQQYPGIFNRYRNTGMLRLLYGEYNFKAVCFSAGIFNDTASGREVWTLEDDWYCEQLWKAIN